MSGLNDMKMNFSLHLEEAIPSENGYDKIKIAGYIIKSIENIKIGEITQLIPDPSFVLLIPRFIDKLAGSPDNVGIISLKLDISQISISTDSIKVNFESGFYEDNDYTKKLTYLNNVLIVIINKLTGGEKSPFNSNYHYHFTLVSRFKIDSHELEQVLKYNIDFADSKVITSISKINFNINSSGYDGRISLLNADDQNITFITSLNCNQKYDDATNLDINSDYKNLEKSLIKLIGEMKNE